MKLAVLLLLITTGLITIVIANNYRSQNLKAKAQEEVLPASTPSAEVSRKVADQQQKQQQQQQSVKQAVETVKEEVKNTVPPKAAFRWSIQSVSSMKETKDRICGQRDAGFILRWVGKAKELGANYVSIEMPYDNPSCGDSVAYARRWTTAIRTLGMNVWHRHMPIAFEGIYDVSKNVDVDYLPLITNYIKNNRDLFAPGDIFTPIPEPQNGGIRGINYCSQDKCYFRDRGHFNSWLREAISASSAAFDSIGLGGKIKIGYYGLDGYIVWGDNNPDWNGILEDSTVAAMGVLTIDHYPEAVGDTMANDLKELHAKYPNVQVVLGEWGTIKGGNVEQQVKDSLGSAASDPLVVGVNYWHMGVGGNEALINEDFSNRAQFDEVQSYFRR